VGQLGAQLLGDYEERFVEKVVDMFKLRTPPGSVTPDGRHRARQEAPKHGSPETRYEIAGSFQDENYPRASAQASRPQPAENPASLIKQ